MSRTGSLGEKYLLLRGAIALSLLLAALLSAPSLAAASTATISGGALNYTAASGELNNVTVTVDGSQLRVHDTGAVIMTGGGCMPEGADALCSMQPKIVFDLGDGADIGVNGTSIASEFKWGIGNDILTGGSGADSFTEGTPSGDGMLNDSDTFTGGGGTDLVDYHFRNLLSSIKVTMGDGLANDGARDVDPGAPVTSEGDNVGSDIENLESGSSGDLLIGNALDNEINGSLGSDTLAGMGGNDTLDDSFDNNTFVESDPGNGNDSLAGDDNDTVTYGPRLDLDPAFVGRSARVVVSADNVAGDGETGESDNVHSTIDNITGGAGDDLLVGSEETFNNENQNTLRGGAGNDQLVGGSAADQLFGEAGDDVFDEGTAANGADVFNGGADIDTVDYSARTSLVPVRIGIGDGSADDGEGLPTNEGDNVLGDVENGRGGAAGDTLVGDGDANMFAGGAGNDTISGNGGDDVFDEGTTPSGADTINGGTGIDTADYSLRTAGVNLSLDPTVSLGNDGDPSGAGEHDALGTDIENLEGGSGADMLTAQAAAINNRLVGGLGMDNITADAGDDEILIRDGIHDTADCGPGADVVTADEVGVDTLNCGGDTINYDDLTAPGAPDLVSTTPASPSSDETPIVNGTAEADSTVRLYLTSNCTGTVFQGTASGSGAFSIEVTVPENQTSQIRGTATDAGSNTSACSAPLSYSEDSTSPGAPTLSGFNRTSPSNDNMPRVFGTAESDSTVTIYGTFNCGIGSELQTGGADQLNSPGIQITVPSDTTTQISATTTDAAGNVSGCSNAISYTEDSTAPAAPVLSGTNPPSPSNDNTPLVMGTAEANAGILVYQSNNCTGPGTGGDAATLGSSGIQITVPPGQTTPITATAFDQAGNPSGCSNVLSYTETDLTPSAAGDTQPPETSILSGPGKRTLDRTPTFRLGASEEGATFKCQLDGRAPVSCGESFTTPKLRRGKHVLRVTATDKAGNADPTPAKRTFRIAKRRHHR